MPNLNDFDLRPGGPASAPQPPRSTAHELLDGDDRRADRATTGSEPTSPRPRRALGLLAVVAVALGLVLAFWLMSRQVEPPAPSTVAEPAADSPEVAGDEPPRKTVLEDPLPPLDQSDSLVRRLAGELSRQPAFTAWLRTGNLARTFAATVENLSLGMSPSPNLPFLVPRDPYRAIARAGGIAGELVPDPASFNRYDLVTEVFSSIDPQAAASVYRRLRSLVQEAYAELGYPDRKFEGALATAIETLLATPIPDTAPVLEQHVSTYHYADPRLESLMSSQKHLLRMGPDNARRIKAQLRRLAAELDLGID